MDVKKLQEKKHELEKHLLSAILDFESEVGLAVGAIKIESRRIDTSTLEGKSSVMGSLEVILML